MSLRVLEGERPGLAVLAFDKAPDVAQLHIAVRSLGTPDQLFLGPAGKWQKSPHYFIAARGDGPHRFVVGPEVVNFVLDQDRVEIVTEDLAVREVTIWENAVPAMAAPLPHSVHRDDRTAATAAAPIVRSTVARTQHLVDPQPEAVAPQSRGAPIQQATEASSSAGHDASHVKPRRWLIPTLIASLLVAVAGAAVAMVPSLQCALWGGNCTASTENAFQRAMTCAAEKLAPTPCEVGQCFVSYERSAAPAPIRPEATRKKLEGEHACGTLRERDRAAADAARKCASALRASRPCDVRSQCLAVYFNEFSQGDARGELEGLGRDAERVCADQRQEAKLAEGVRNCIAGKRAAKQHCEIEPGCIAEFRNSYPRSGALSEFQEAARSARIECDRDTRERQVAAEERAAERAALDDARKCAAAADPCVVPACYDRYMRTYPSGPHNAEARSDLANAKARCPQQTFNLEGTYSGQTRLGCGVPAQHGLEVVVRGGRITWQHDMPLARGGIPITYQWEGTIDSAGVIRAGIRGGSGYSAEGRYSETEREVRMRYPSCNEPITLIIGTRRQ